MERMPIGPTPARADALGRLKRERWFAADAGETAAVARLDREIERLSAAGTATAPTRETATAPTRETAAAPRQHTAARTDKPNPKPKPNPPSKGNRRVSAR